jgi:hypothetical protein
MAIRYKTAKIKKMVRICSDIPGEKCYEIKKRKISLQQVANEYGFKTHCNTIHALKAVENHYEYERQFRELFNQIKNDLAINKKLLKTERYGRN